MDILWKRKSFKKLDFSHNCYVTTQSALWPFCSGFVRKQLRQLVHIQVCPHCLISLTEAKMETNAAHTKPPKLYMYTILVETERRLGDNRIRPGCVPASHKLKTLILSWGSVIAPTASIGIRNSSGHFLHMFGALEILCWGLKVFLDWKSTDPNRNKSSI